MSGTIHVTCGYCALNEALSISSRDIVSLRDDLSCGPLVALDDLDSWCAMRQAYWDHAEGEPAKTRKRRRRSNNGTRDYVFGSLDRLADAHEVVIWLGTGLAEQLALAWMPQLLRAIGGRVESVHIVQFEQTLSGTAIPTIRILSGDEFKNSPIPRPIESEGLAYLDKAWSAATTPRPASFIGFIDQVPSPFPLLHAAFERILWRYPDARSGINRYEARLLASTRDVGPTAARVVASSMKAFFVEENECVGDNWLFWRLRGLADPTLPHPAVALTGERTTIRGTEAHLTPEGEQFLKAELNFVELNGIEDWVGGVHLDSRVGDVWFHQDKKILRG
jgi:Domain of unknown function (DUF1835)